MIVQTLPRSHPIPIPIRFPSQAHQATRLKAKDQTNAFPSFHSYSHPIHPTPVPPMPVRHSSKKEVKPRSSQVNTPLSLSPAPRPRQDHTPTGTRPGTHLLPLNTRLSLPVTIHRPPWTALIPQGGIQNPNAPSPSCARAPVRRTTVVYPHRP